MKRRREGKSLVDRLLPIDLVGQYSPKIAKERMEIKLKRIEEIESEIETKLEEYKMVCGHINPKEHLLKHKIFNLSSEYKRLSGNYYTRRYK